VTTHEKVCAAVEGAGFIACVAAILSLLWLRFP
jgi:hypothetical protein